MTTWVRADDLAEIFDVPASTIRRWISEGRIDSRGKRPTRVDLEQFLEQNRRRNRLPNSDE